MTKERKILSFDRDADFFYNKFEKNIDQGKYFDALSDIRTAVAKDQDDPDLQLALAELYTEMELYEESNSELLDLLSKGQLLDGDCLYGLGCNFLGMRELDKAEECLELYLDKYPDEPYFYDAMELLDMIDEEREEYGEEPYDGSYYDEVMSGKQMMDEGDYRGAAEKWESVIAGYDDAFYLKNNLALAYFCDGRAEEAIDLTRSILAKEPSNLYACCNMVLFYGEYGKCAEQEVYLDKIARLNPANAEEQCKLALTYLEVGDSDKALAKFKDALDETPYDVNTIFLAAATAANSGRLTEAAELLTRITRIDPDDMIAVYYKKLILEAKDKGEGFHMEYTLQVPPTEIERRLTYLNETVGRGPEVVAELWKNDRLFACTMKWVLTLNDSNIKLAVLDMLRAVGDGEAQRVMKNYILRRDEPDEVKNEAFLMMRSMGISPPYYAYLAGKYIEVRVGEFGAGRTVTENNMRVFERVIEGASILELDSDRIPSAVKVLEKYIELHEKPPVMRNTNAWAAAILVLATRGDENELQTDEIAEKLGAAEKAVLRCLGMILELFQKKAKNCGGEK